MNGDAFRLDGQLALVTGGGTGLGFGICQAMVEAGARVVITGRREDVLHDACVQLKGGAQYLVHDINDLPSAPTLVEEVEDPFAKTVFVLAAKSFAAFQVHLGQG